MSSRSHQVDQSIREGRCFGGRESSMWAVFCTSVCVQVVNMCTVIIAEGEDTECKMSQVTKGQWPCLR